MKNNLYWRRRPQSLTMLHRNNRVCLKKPNHSLGDIGFLSRGRVCMCVCVYIQLIIVLLFGYATL